jgi:hypothetical protein
MWFRPDRRCWDVMSMMKGGPGYGGGVKTVGGSGDGSGGWILHQTELVSGI